MRNICAHHGRLWNRKFILQLPKIKRYQAWMQIEALPAVAGAVCSHCGHSPKGNGVGVQYQPGRRIYNYLLVLALLMAKIAPEEAWARRVVRHIEDGVAPSDGAPTLPANWAEQMGFPNGWAQFDVWAARLG